MLVSYIYLFGPSSYLNNILTLLLTIYLYLCSFSLPTCTCFLIFPIKPSTILRVVVFLYILKTTVLLLFSLPLYRFFFSLFLFLHLSISFSISSFLTVLDPIFRLVNYYLLGTFNSSYYLNKIVTLSLCSCLHDVFPSSLRVPILVVFRLTHLLLFFYCLILFFFPSHYALFSIPPTCNLL